MDLIHEQTALVATRTRAPCLRQHVVQQKQRTGSPRAKEFRLKTPGSGLTRAFLKRSSLGGGHVPASGRQRLQHGLRPL